MKRSRSGLSSARASGFSLTEMLVVIGIIAVLAAATLPSLIGFFKGSKIRTAQDQLASDIQRTRTTAITKNTQMGIDFIVQDKSTYWIHIEDSIAGFAGTANDVGFTRQAVNFATPNTVSSTKYILPPGVEFGAGVADCPQAPAVTATYAGFSPNASAVRFDRYGALTVPGLGNPVAPALAGSPTTTNRIYLPASGDLIICLVDKTNGANLRHAVRISTSGRVIRDQAY